MRVERKENCKLKKKIKTWKANNTENKWSSVDGKERKRKSDKGIMTSKAEKRKQIEIHKKIKKEITEIKNFKYARQ